MKKLMSLAIMLLTAALGGTLFVTKPSQKSFEDFYAQQATKGESGFGAMIGDAAAREYAKTFTYNDRYLWVDVTKDGKTAFTGAAGHWMPRDTSVAKPQVSK
jgi:hypothetical protein